MVVFTFTFSGLRYSSVDSLFDRLVSCVCYKFSCELNTAKAVMLKRTPNYVVTCIKRQSNDILSLM